MIVFIFKTALTRDPKKLLRSRGTDSKQYVYVFSSSGKRISKFEVGFYSNGFTSDFIVELTTEQITTLYWLDSRGITYLCYGVCFDLLLD